MLMKNKNRAIDQNQSWCRIKCTNSFAMLNDDYHCQISKKPKRKEENNYISHFINVWSLCSKAQFYKIVQR